MHLSSLRTRASVMQKTLAPDGGGGFSESWDEIAAVWCAIEPVSGADALEAGKLESRARHRITLRRMADAKAGNRIQAGIRTFAIRAVLDEGAQNPFIVLLCEELPEGSP